MRSVLCVALPFAAVSLFAIASASSLTSRVHGSVPALSPLVRSCAPFKTGLGGDKASLQGVEATSSLDAWAVGSEIDASAATLRNFTAHWDGTSWTSIPVPSHSVDTENLLTGVASWTNGTAVAVGYVSKPDHSFTMDFPTALTWDGTKWSFATVDVPEGGVLSGVAATSTGGAWAVGVRYVSSGEGNRPLLEHWNGAMWTSVAPPAATPAYASLAGVAVATENDVWAVGSSYAASSRELHPLILHYNGSSWSVSRTPHIPNASLNAVVAIPNTKVLLAVGTEHSSSSASGERTLILEWRGAGWVRNGSPDVGSTELTTISAASQTNAIAVGQSNGPGFANLFLTGWNGSDWSIGAMQVPKQYRKPIAGQAALIPGTTSYWVVGNYGLSRATPLILKCS